MAGMALCTTMTTGYAAGGARLGDGYISSVTSNGSCVSSDTNGGGIQFWDIAAGGTYTVTLSGIDDACGGGNNDPIGVVVHNSIGGNIYVLANQQSQGVYTFTITLDGQCLTMPIEYCTHDASGSPANQPGTGKFAQDYNGTAAAGHPGHLRTATFGDNCAFIAEDDTCHGCTQPASITVCKYYDRNANGTHDSDEPYLPNWPICFNGTEQTTGSTGCNAFSVAAGSSVAVSEATAASWLSSAAAPTSLIIQAPDCGLSASVEFGNYCTHGSGGLTLGFWSNKNGNKLMTGNAQGSGTSISSGVVGLLNSCSLRNADGSVHTFTSSYSDFRTWLLGATATNMAYMLSAQLAALKLDVYFNFVNAGDFDLCSNETITALINEACGTLGTNGNTTSAGPVRTDQERLKNCIDAINNGAQVVPFDPSTCGSKPSGPACSQ